MNSDGGSNQDLLPTWRFGNLSMPLVAVMDAVGKAVEEPNVRCPLASPRCPPDRGLKPQLPGLRAAETGRAAGGIEAQERLLHNDLPVFFQGF